MGAKTWMLAYVEGKASDHLSSDPSLDRQACAALAAQLFPAERLEPIADGNLSYTCPPDNEIYVGCFPGVRIVAAREFGIDRPSKLGQHFLAAANGAAVYLHAMHSVVDWFAYAIWVNGKLQRSLSVSPDNGVIEDIGARLDFEQPFWSGAQPACDPEDDDNDYPLAFHPLELGEAALLHLFGYQLEGFMEPGHLEPEHIPLAGFRRARRKWKLW
ncbi:hypothetical protein D0B54_17855 [Solimonas sp. K1W22B-7]|uniref:DUF6928 family protein n=1 Tax=Solimonas sp. K1W22B-7 TaxID=2303331 RepID=UPI000E3360D3|nr:hypothetical protein [Solimonas sp. K1W22B-7]AXQ30426.1 hypothetical protein D0B54_17855 [Solimonas sp. K1W22B-7]